MKHTHKIYFFKERSFEQLLSDTFGFIRQELKPLLKCVFGIVLPYLSLLIFSQIAYMYYAGNIFDFNADTLNLSSFTQIIISTFIYLFSTLFCYMVIHSSVLYYIKSYNSQTEKVDIQEVKQQVYSNFWNIFILSLFVSLTSFFALLFCLLPILYIMVPMHIVLCIYVFQRKPLIDSYTYSFSLVNEDFWSSFGVIILLFIIAIILSMVFSIPATVYSYIKTGIFSGEIDPSFGNIFKDPIYILFTLISNLFQIFLSIISVVGAALVYFHLNEKRNQTGTLETINQLGES